MCVVVVLWLLCMHEKVWIAESVVQHYGSNHRCVEQGAENLTHFSYFGNTASQERVYFCFLALKQMRIKALESLNIQLYYIFFSCIFVWVLKWKHKAHLMGWHCPLYCCKTSFWVVSVWWNFYIFHSLVLVWFLFKFISSTSNCTVLSETGAQMCMQFCHF